MKQCGRLGSLRKDGTRWQCLNFFPASDPCKTCPHHRKMSAAQNKSSATFAGYMKAYQQSEAGKASQKRTNGSEKGKMRQKKYAKTEKAKRCNKRANDKISARLSSSLYKMVRGTHNQPVTFVKLGIFSSNDDAEAHFVSTFEPWMTMQNLGAYRNGDEYGSKWNIGHRIPRVWYGVDDNAELKKCWSKSNLYAQCARENVETVDSIKLTKIQWLALKGIWPKQCQSKTDEEAWLWASTNQAKVERGRRK